MIRVRNQLQYKAAAKELVACSVTEEGNITYTLNQDISNPRAFAMIEIWKDQGEINKHNAKEHFTTIAPKLGEMAQEQEITLYREAEWE